MTISSAAVLAAPALPVAARLPAQESGSKSTVFAAQLSGLASFDEDDISAAPVVRAAAAAPSAASRRAGSQNNSKKESAPQAATVPVTLAGATPPILPLSFQYPSRDGNGDHESQSGTPTSPAAADSQTETAASSAAAPVSAHATATATPEMAFAPRIGTSSSPWPWMNGSKSQPTDAETHAASSDTPAPGSPVGAAAPAARKQAAASAQETTTGERHSAESSAAAPVHQNSAPRSSDTAAPALSFAAARLPAEESASKSTAFAAPLSGSTSSGEVDIRLAPVARTAAAAPSLPAAALNKDSKEETTAPAATTPVTLAGAGPQIRPLSFPFPSREGNGDRESQSGTSTSPTAANSQTETADASSAAAPVGANAMATATPEMAFALRMNPSNSPWPWMNGTKSQPTDAEVRSASPDKPSAGSPEQAAAPAARVQAPASAQETTTGERHSPESQVAAPARKSSVSDSSDTAGAVTPARPADSAASQQQAAAAFETTSHTAESPSAHVTAAPQPTAETVPAAAEPQSASTTPLKDISFHLTQAGAEKVEVRVVQQAGEVHVAVRTGDTDLAHGLRQGLTDLVGKLEDTGYRAETWRPGGSTTAAAPVSQSPESQNTSGQSSNGDSSGRQSGSQQQGGQQNQNAFNRPRWVEELESSLTGGGESTGDENGIGS